MQLSHKEMQNELKTKSTKKTETFITKNVVHLKDLLDQKCDKT